MAEEAGLFRVVARAAELVRGLSSTPPLVGVVLGSGLGELAEPIEEACRVPYTDIPHHPLPSVAGHVGELVLGRLEGVQVATWQGRAHFYEGHSMAQVAFPMRLLRQLGATAVCLINAAGGLDETFVAGDLMLLADHLNLPGLVGHHPLRGPHEDELGERFVDLADAYDPELRRLAARVAKVEGIDLREGVYAMVAGPSYETPAEARLLRRLGADAVGMSTVPEVVVARQAGLRVVAISVITNVLLGAQAATTTSHAEVLAAAEQAKPRLARLLRGMLSQMPELLKR